MKKSRQFCQFLLLINILWILPLWGQSSSFRLDYVGHINFPASAAGCGNADTTGGTDVWGYVGPDGTDYALMGVMDGFAAVRIPDLTVIDVIAGPQTPSCYWHRDIKTYGHYAYMISQMTGTNQGLMILDLSTLPDSVRYVGSYVNGAEIASHNLSIDTTSGFAYVTNSARNGIRFIDLADPENPQDVYNLIVGFVHDVYTHNDTMYVSEGSLRTFSIWDVADKTSPQLISRINVSGGGYAHNAWPTEDGKYLLTTEETVGKTVKIWDIQDMSNINKVGDYLGSNNLAHNVHIMGDLAVISHYAYGVVLLDISDPAFPEELDHYDTYPLNNAGGFYGNWGAYPFTNNGYIYASDVSGKLTLLKLVEFPVGSEPQENILPEKLTLFQNYPNPFNPETTIEYQLPENAPVRLNIYNVAGQQIRTLVNKVMPSGLHTVRWDGRLDSGEKAPSGTYFYKLTASGKQQIEVVKKMILLQ